MQVIEFKINIYFLICPKIQVLVSKYEINIALKLKGHKIEKIGHCYLLFNVRPRDPKIRQMTKFDGPRPQLFHYIHLKYSASVHKMH